MFRIRRSFDDLLPANRDAIREAATILRSQFPAVKQTEFDRIPDLLRNPCAHRFRTSVYVAEGSSGKVRGVAVLNHDPRLGFCYLDCLAAGKGNNPRSTLQRTP